MHAEATVQSCRSPRGVCRAPRRPLLGIQIRRHAGILTREVLSHLRPALAAVCCLVEVLVREIERPRIGFRKNQWLRPGVAVLCPFGASWSATLRGNILCLAGHDIAARHRAAK